MRILGFIRSRRTSREASLRNAVKFRQSLHGEAPLVGCGKAGAIVPARKLGKPCGDGWEDRTWKGIHKWFDFWVAAPPKAGLLFIL